jgi:hypothetical protein
VEHHCFAEEFSAPERDVPHFVDHVAVDEDFMTILRCDDAIWKGPSLPFTLRIDRPRCHSRTYPESLQTLDRNM